MQYGPVTKDNTSRNLARPPMGAPRIRVMTLSTEAQAILDEESNTLKTVVDSLEAQQRALYSQLSEEKSRARTLTAEIVASRRDEEKQLLASDEAVSHALSEKHREDVENLSSIIPKPYFARIKLVEDKNGKVKELEYKIGLKANPDCRIVDWRKAPISKLYYEYKEGEEYAEEIQGVLREGKIAQRNSLEIQKSALKRVHCRFGSFKKDGESWIQESAGASSRADGTVGTLPSVLTLITPEQFRLITEDADTAVLLQGVAGSGKTSVALHRLAWLLHEENSDCLAERCAVLVPNQILKSYIRSALPSLDVHGVEILSFDEWATRSIRPLLPQFFSDGEVSRPSEPASPSLERVRGSHGVLAVMEDSFRRLLNETAAKIKASLPLDEAPQTMRQVFEHDCQKASSFRDLFDAGRKLAAQPSFPHSMAYPLEALFEEMRERAPSPEDLVIASLARARDIVAADDSKLINESMVRAAFERTSANFELGVLDPSDTGLLLRGAQLIYGEIGLPDGTRGKYDHLVVDEVQDLSSTSLAAVVGAVPTLSALTLVGDFHQKISAQSGFTGWERLKSLHAFKDSLSRFMSLTVSHRSTEPIMKLAHAIQGQGTAAGGRPGRTPIWFHCKTESLGIESAVKWLTTALERYPSSATAVICKSDQDARLAHSLLSPTFSQAISLLDETSFSFAAGLVVTDVRSAKGLEFKNVLIWNPNKQTYGDEPLDRNLLYTAITRAEENVCLTTWGAASPCLPSLNSPLVRGIRVAPEEEIS